MDIYGHILYMANKLIVILHGDIILRERDIYIYIYNRHTMGIYHTVSLNMAC
jgi:hypothetical protein